jgi:hypothetical protein
MTYWFLPTNEALLELARLTGREPNDPALTQPFDALEVRGHLAPWLPDWWELIRWQSQKVRGDLDPGLSDER